MGRFPHRFDRRALFLCMARVPDWYLRLEDLLLAVQESSREKLGRGEVQTLLACSERDSQRLLKRWGATRTDGALQIERAALLRQLETLRDSPAYRTFLQKQGQVAARLTEAKPAAKARFRRIAGSLEGVPRQLAELPEGLTLEPGRLEVRFQVEEDLWHLLDQLADIAAQDEHAFRQRAEPTIPARRKRA